MPGYPPPAGSVNQLPLVFQSVEPSEIHDASSAKVTLCIESKSNVAVASSNDVCDFLEKLNLVFMLILHWPAATPQTLWARMLGKVWAPSQVLICDAEGRARCRLIILGTVQAPVMIAHGSLKSPAC